MFGKTHRVMERAVFDDELGDSQGKSAQKSNLHNVTSMAPPAHDISALHLALKYGSLNMKWLLKEKDV